MLIPLYVLVGVWGGPERVRATVTFVIYTMAGSLLMLASIVAFGVSQGSFSLQSGSTSSNDWIFLGFLAAFAVKAPLFPFHGWLRAVYTQSTPEVAAVLSGVVSKAAVFGFVMIVLPCPSRSTRTAPSSSCWQPPGSCTARCSHSARPTCAASSPTPRSGKWA